MKILITTQKVDKNDPILGFFHSWIIEFARQCEEVIVICLFEGAHDLPKNVRVFSLGKEKGSSLLSKIITFYTVIFRERKRYNAVFVHMNQIYILLGGIFWRLMGKKVSLWYTHKHVSLSLRIAEKITQKIFSASKESFRLFSKKLLVTGHGIDTGVFTQTERSVHEHIVLTSIGRISKVKKLDKIVEALALLPQEVLNKVTLRIVGSAVTDADSEYEGLLRNKIQALNLSLRVSFEGIVSNEKIPAFLDEVDININLSGTGSMDKAVLESMSCGVLTLSSNVAFKDILSPYGLYIENDTKESLAQDIQGAIGKISNAELKKSLRNYVVVNHSLNNLISKLIHNLS